MLFSIVNKPSSLCTVNLSGARRRADGKLSSADLLKQQCSASGRVARAADVIRQGDRRSVCNQGQMGPTEVLQHC